MENCLLNPEQECYGLKKALEVERDLNELSKRNSATHERLFTRIGELEKQEGIQAEQYKHIMGKLDQISEDVDELKSKPAKRWDNVTEKIIGIIVAAVLGFMLARLGL